MLRSRGELFYWRDGKHEVDFVLKRENLVMGFEVKSNSRKPIGGLNAFTSNFNKALGFSLDEETALKLLAASDVDSFIDSELLSGGYEATISEKSL